MAKMGQKKLIKGKLYVTDRQKLYFYGWVDGEFYFVYDILCLDHNIYWFNYEIVHKKKTKYFVIISFWKIDEKQNYQLETYD